VAALGLASPIGPRTEGGQAAHRPDVPRDAGDLGPPSLETRSWSGGLRDLIHPREPALRSAIPACPDVFDGGIESHPESIGVMMSMGNPCRGLILSWPSQCVTTDFHAAIAAIGRVSEMAVGLEVEPTGFSTGTTRSLRSE